MAMADAPSPLIAAYLNRRQDLVRFFALRLRSEQAAEDLVQEIYLRAAAAARQDEIRNPESYLFKLGSNLMLDRLRSQRRAGRRDYVWLDLHAGSEDGRAPEPSAERVVEARQQLQRIVEILGELPPATQDVFRLHKFDGLTHAEVAKRLGISRSAVEKHVMAVLRRLEKALPR
jgi:RNA polymerase sigma-70 factor (ECF subfamily)